MITLVAFFLLGSTTNLPSVPNTNTANSTITHPAFVDVPKSPNGLTL